MGRSSSSSSLPLPPAPRQSKNPRETTHADKAQRPRAPLSSSPHFRVDPEQVAVASLSAHSDGSGDLGLGRRAGDQRGGDERRRRPKRDHRARHRRAGLHRLLRHPRHSGYARARVSNPPSLLPRVRVRVRPCAGTRYIN